MNRPKVLMFLQVWREVRLHGEIRSVWCERPAHRANDRRRIGGVVQHIKAGNQVELTRRKLDSIDSLEGHPIGKSLSLGVGSRPLDGRDMGIEAPEARLRESFGHDQ